MGYQFFPSLVTIVLLDLLHISIAWKITILALIITDIKTYPLVWHIRLLNALRFVLPSHRAEPGPCADSIFQPLVTSSHCSLSEIDFNWHKSNSTYYSDLDIARTHLLCTLFSLGIDQARHKHGNGIINLRKGGFTIKLGGVKCGFKREIRPYQRYEMWSRVLSWDTKWLYTITHFVRKDPKSNQCVVCATAISKCVFKSGRRTVLPEDMLHDSGLLPRTMLPRPLPLPAVGQNTVLCEMPRREEEEKYLGASHKYPDEPGTLPPSDFLNGEEWIGCPTIKPSQSGGWTSEMIEHERRRGLGVVNAGDLDDLDRDFSTDVEVLGRHFDL